MARDPFFAYSIPIQGLKNGVHNYKYLLDNEFFSHFEESPIMEAEVEASLQLDKRSDMLVLDFWIEGWTKAECDRCTAAIQLPLETEQQLLVKYGDQMEDDDDEVIFIPREASELNVAKYLYEYSVLAMPLINRYDCENDPNPPCNREVLAFLTENSEENEPAASIWDALKNLENKN